MIPSLILRHQQDDVTAEFRCQVMDIIRCPISVKHPQKLASISARRSGGSGARAMAISRPAKHDERSASNAQDMFTGHGVRSARKRGLLAMRAAGPAYRRAADHKSGASANTLASGGWGEATTLSRIVKMKSGTLSASPPSAAAMIGVRQDADLPCRPAIPAAVMTMRTTSASRMARRPRSLFVPNVEAKSHETTSPAAARQAKTLMTSLSPPGITLRSAAANAITPAMKVAGSSTGNMMSQ